MHRCAPRRWARSFKAFFSCSGFETSAGDIEILAEVVTVGSTLRLSNLSVAPVELEPTIPGVKVLRGVVQEIVEAAAAQGFECVEFEGGKGRRTQNGPYSLSRVEGPMSEQEILAEVKKLHSEQASPEAVLSFLRGQGVTKINSIRLWHLATGVSLPESKRLVFNSLTWSDRRDNDEAFVDALLEGMNTAHERDVAA